MAMNPMQRKTRNAFLLGFIAALIVGGIVIAILFMQLKNKNTEIDNMRKAAQVAMKNVYVLNKDVEEKEAIEAISKSIPIEYVPDDAITSLSNYMDDDGNLSMMAKTKLSKGTILTSDVVEKDSETASYRMVEYTMISLPSLLTDGDYIDIRIAYPDSLNFVVLSKVEVQSCSTSTIWLKLSESQMLMLNEAIIESYIIEGTKLYATQYVDGAQAELNTTYVPNTNVIALIQKNATEAEQEAIDELQKDGTVISARDYIDSILGSYDHEEQVTSVEEGYQAETSTIQAIRAELLGDMGY